MSVERDAPGFVIARLEAEIARLRQEVEALRARGPGASMRAAQQCPACGGKKLLHVSNLQEWTHGGLTPMALLHEKRWYGPKNVAGLEAFICGGCGLVEWYATGLEGLNAETALHEKVAVIDPTPPGGEGPYR